MLIYLELEPYLRDWFKYFCGCTHLPVVLPKGCIEAKLLRVYLRAPREGEKISHLAHPGATSIQVPVFHGHNPDSENYLSVSARNALKSVIRDRFDVDLWLSLGDAPLHPETKKDLVCAWMDARGIEDTMTNYETVMKRLQKLRDRHAGAVRQKRFRSARKKRQEN